MTESLQQTRRHKEFSAAIGERDPISFTVNGQTFRCIPRIPAGLFLRLASTTTNNADSIVDFINGVLEDQDVERFKAMLNDKHNILDVELLSEIMAWLVEEYVGRPLAIPSTSANGQPGIGQ